MRNSRIFKPLATQGPAVFPHGEFWSYTHAKVSLGSFGCLMPRRTVGTNAAPQRFWQTFPRRLAGIARFDENLCLTIPGEQLKCEWIEGYPA
jgi:hypothetical protein